MKTIRTPNPASIVRFLKRLITVVFVSYFIFFCAYVVCYRYFSYHAIRYESHEEVVELFKNNTEDFENMVKLLEETDVINKLGLRWYLGQERFTHPAGNSLSHPWEQLTHSGFVSNAQLEELADFFEKFGVDHIDNYTLGNYNETNYLFFFWTETYNVYIMYIASEEDMSNKIAERYSSNDNASRVSDHWYYALTD